MAAPQGPCPLPGGARFAGIESRDDAPPRSMAMRHGGGGTERERGVFRAKRKRKRVSAKPIERHREVAEAMSRGAESREAQPHEMQ